MEKIDERREICGFLEKKLAEEYTLVDNAVRYIALSGGHLWRPRMLIRTAQSYNVKIQTAVPYAASLEVIHCATLVLDDLPSMDNSALRLGKNSCHIEYGVDVAELSVQDLIADHTLFITKEKKIDAEKRIKIIEEIATSVKNLIRGQLIDLREASKIDDINKMLDFYKRKTGALFGSAAVIGGMLGNAPERDLKYLRNFGLSVGLAFQLYDDLFDRTGIGNYQGKPTGQDSRKKTPIDIVGTKRTFGLGARFEKNALRNLRKIKRDFSPLLDLFNEMKSYEMVSFT